MTTPDPNVLEFNTDNRRRLTDNDRFPFRIDAVDYTLIRPKQSVLVEMVTAGAHMLIADFENLNAEDLGKIGYVVERFLLCIEQPGQSRLRRRLADPMDDLDLIEFLPMIQKLTAEMMPRPTTAQPASS